MFYLVFTLPLFALIAPFILWPIELIFPFPHIVEEVTKGIFVWFLLALPHKKTQIVLGILIGSIFALSESCLYIFNILLVGTLQTFFIRLAFTALLHSGTLMIMLIATRINKKLAPLGLLLAILIHYLYNMLIHTYK